MNASPTPNTDSANAATAAIADISPPADRPPTFGAFEDAPHLAHWPKRLPRNLVVPTTTLWFNLEVSAKRFADKAAYVFFGQTLSYRQLHEQALALAAWLQQQGVQRGDRVMIYLQNCPQWPVAFYAIQRLDAVAVPVNPMNRVDELGHYITDPQSRVGITSLDLAPALHEANQRLPQGQRMQRILVARLADHLPQDLRPEDEGPAAMMAWLRLAADLPPGATAWKQALSEGQGQLSQLPLPQARPDDLAILPYTSGTTALPKGCMHSHASLMPNVVAGQWSHSGPESLGLAVVPMFHITGLMMGVLAGVAQGSTQVILPRWDRELAARCIAQHRITHWVCIPTMIIDMLGSPNVAQFDLSSLRNLSGGGAAMPEAVAARLEQQWGLVFAEGYGLTETAAPSHSNPPERAKRQCLGVPFFGVDSRVVDPQTLQEVPNGETGEIIISGPMLFKGYWQHPQASAEAFVQWRGRSYFRTGDLGRRDEEGYFFITDRLKRMINASGYKVWPSEVELMLFKCPLVQEACVIAAHDAYRGETVKAVVVLKAPFQAQAKAAAQDEAAALQALGEQIMAWAREHMAAYKVPRQVEFVQALPKSGSGKVMWRSLQDQQRAKEHGAQA